MKSRIGTLAVLALALACPSAHGGTGHRRPTGRRRRPKRSSRARSRTDGHTIEQDKNGPQPCDGTNGGANPTPGPTVTSALDDAVAWDGTCNPSFSDFLVNRIGSDTATDTQFWGTALNGTPTELGGCQVQVKTGDDVLWAYDMFSAKQFLELSGPRTARAGPRRSGSRSSTPRTATSRSRARPSAAWPRRTPRASRRSSAERPRPAARQGGAPRRDPLERVWWSVSARTASPHLGGRRGDVARRRGARGARPRPLVDQMVVFKDGTRRRSARCARARRA